MYSTGLSYELYVLGAAVFPVGAFIRARRERVVNFALR